MLLTFESGGLAPARLGALQQRESYPLVSACTPELSKQIEIASNKARADARTWRVASMTELVEPVTSTMSVQKCLTHNIRRKHLMDAGDNCSLEALVLRTFSPRFMHRIRTGEFANSLIMPEATRSLIYRIRSSGPQQCKCPEACSEEELRRFRGESSREKVAND